MDVNFNHNRQVFGVAATDMPFTPFHFGPGLLLKGVMPRRFSWSTFALTQIVIDTETLYNMANHRYPWHRSMHTFVGATLVGGLTALGILVARKTIRGWEKWSPVMRSELSTAGVLIGGLLGGALHPVLDGIMHKDIRPFMPWSDANPLLGMIDLTLLHLGCTIAGIIGLGLLLFWLNQDKAFLPVSGTGGK